MTTGTVGTDISRGLQLCLWRIRNRLNTAKQNANFNHNEPNHQEDMKPLFPRLQNWFPEIAHGKAEERKELRHAILAALVGRPIASQYDISAGEHRILREVCNDSSSYLTRQLADELTEAVQGAYCDYPWEVPTAGLTPG